MNNDKLEVLMQEYNLMNEKIEQFLSTQFKMLNTILLTIGGVLAFILSGQDRFRVEYVYYLPFLILIMLVLLGYHHQRTIGIQGYKKYLEHKINTMVKENLIFYGHIGMEYMGKTNYFAVGNVVIYIMTYIFSIYLVHELAGEISTPFIVGYVISSVVFLIMLIPSLNYTNKVQKLSHYVNSIENNTEESGTIDDIIGNYIKTKKFMIKEKSENLMINKENKNLDE